MGAQELEHLQVVEDLKASSRFQRDAVQPESKLRLRANYVGPYLPVPFKVLGLPIGRPL